jgi:hypothetical protein
MADDVLEDAFSLFAMVHTRSYETPDGPRDTRPWDGSAGAAGVFTYASMPCRGQAPINNLSSDLPVLGGALPGGRVPASTRTHPLSFEVERDGDAVRLRGAIVLTVCRLGPGATGEDDPTPDPERPRITLDWTATVGTRTAELVTWHGRFSLTGGTGPYGELAGGGEVAGYFFNFDREGATDDGPALRDGQYALVGRYRVPVAALPWSSAR